MQVWSMSIQIVKALFLFRAPWQRTFWLGSPAGDVTGLYFAGRADKQDFTRFPKKILDLPYMYARMWVRRCDVAWACQEKACSPSGFCPLDWVHIGEVQL